MGSDGITIPFFPVLTFIGQTSLPLRSKHVHGHPPHPRFRTIFNKLQGPNKQHLICKLPILDSIPRGGGKPRR